MFVQIESVRRPSKRKRSPSVEREHERENIPVATRSASKGSRVLSFQVPRISQAQKKLLEHETALKQKEKDIKRREADVDKKLETMRQVEFVIDKSESALASVRKELLEFVDLHIIPGAEASLQRLEADFTCPLCLDVMACPYALNAPRCGHTFCGLCLLQWYFSCLHGCGGWHEQVECPICRSPSQIAHGLLPRSIFSCPFIPNRLVGNQIDDSVAKLSAMGALASRAMNITIGGSNKKKRKVSEIEEEKISPIVMDWAENGSSKQDWTKRMERGRTEMAFITSQWVSLTPYDFLDVKKRLGV